MKVSDLLNRLRQWLQELNIENNGDNPTIFRSITIVASLIVTGLVSNVIAAYVSQDILNNNFPLALMIGLIILMTFATVLQIKGLPFNVKPLKIIAVLLTLAIVQSSLIAYLWVSNQPPLTYIVLDATEATIPIYGELVQNIRLTSQVQPPQSLGGLRIYGGQLSDVADCRDTVQFIAPIRSKEFEQELDLAFGSFDPKGNASLTTAVLEAVRDDLKSFRGQIKLIVITGGIDPKCEPQLGGIFEEIAEDINENTSQEITIAIVGVGNLSVIEEATLQNYAEALSGKYLNASNPANLSSLILASPNYFPEYDNK